MQRDIINETASEMQDNANGIVREWSEGEYPALSVKADTEAGLWDKPKEYRHQWDTRHWKKEVSDGGTEWKSISDKSQEYKNAFMDTEKGDRIKSRKKILETIRDMIYILKNLPRQGRGNNEVSNAFVMLDAGLKELKSAFMNTGLPKMHRKMMSTREHIRAPLPESKSVFADQIAGAKTLMEDDASGYVPEGGEAQPWFDEKYGWLLRDIPEAAIDEIAVSGDNGPAVEKWCRQLRFDEKIPIERAKAALKRTGGYEDEDLERMTPFELAQNVLWLLCHTIQDYQGEAEASPDSFDDEDMLQSARQRKSAGMYTIDEL